jgi:SP family general alpha glucoside:H+ symporter-like MFS transporter
MDEEHDLKGQPVPGQVGLTQAQIDADIDVDLDLVHVGYQVVARQKEESFAQVWKQHWRGGVWSLAISMALWMEGYDTNVVRTVYCLGLFLVLCHSPPAFISDVMLIGCALYL